MNIIIELTLLAILALIYAVVIFAGYTSRAQRQSLKSRLIANHFIDANDDGWGK